MNVDWETAERQRWDSWNDDQRAEYVAALDEASERLDLAELVYNMRVQAGLTQTELGRRSGTGQPYVSAVERGAKTPTVETLRRMAAATGQRLRLVLEPR
ncbi:MAG: helix-turn-helix domain-containing protein [Propionibacteriaceae bacterium]|jgi:ribosome-binding protein aMBF1 (putative translation factor)|nr:helix-turn-helix domain-containing protein [Propionibacteriaceae bacterium]